MVWLKNCAIVSEISDLSLGWRLSIPNIGVNPARNIAADRMVTGGPLVGAIFRNKCIVYFPATRCEKPPRFEGAGKEM